jgi:hypothetical protein
MVSCPQLIFNPGALLLFRFRKDRVGFNVSPQMSPHVTCGERYKQYFRNKRQVESDAESQQGRTLQSRTMNSAGKAHRRMPTCRNSDLGSIEETQMSSFGDSGSVAQDVTPLRKLL